MSAGDDYWAIQKQNDRRYVAEHADAEELLKRARAWEDYYSADEGDKSAEWYGFANTLAEIHLLETVGE